MRKKSRNIAATNRKGCSNILNHHRLACLASRRRSRADGSATGVVYGEGAAASSCVGFVDSDILDSSVRCVVTWDFWNIDVTQETKSLYTNRPPTRNNPKASSESSGGNKPHDRASNRGRVEAEVLPTVQKSHNIKQKAGAIAASNKDGRIVLARPQTDH